MGGTNGVRAAPPPPRSVLAAPYLPPRRSAPPPSASSAPAAPYSRARPGGRGRRRGQRSGRAAPPRAERSPAGRGSDPGTTAPTPPTRDPPSPPRVFTNWGVPAAPPAPLVPTRGIPLLPGAGCGERGCVTPPSSTPAAVWAAGCKRDSDILSQPKTRSHCHLESPPCPRPGILTQGAGSWSPHGLQFPL